jgi:hypothetical protein
MFEEKSGLYLPARILSYCTVQIAKIEENSNLEVHTRG